MRRFFIQTSIIFGIVLALTSCGTIKGDKKSSETKKPTQSSLTDQDKALAKEFAGLPGVVIKVPLDKAGKEQENKAEMKLFQGTQELSSQNAEAIWQQSSAPKSVISGEELDTDTSVQSWQEWRPGYNHGINQGYNDVNHNYNDINIENNQNSNIDVNVHNNNNYYNTYYGSYRPLAYSLVNSYSYWTYHRPYRYCFSSCYYYYPRPSCSSSWGWCGYYNNNYCGNGCGNNNWNNNNWY